VFEAQLGDTSIDDVGAMLSSVWSWRHGGPAVRRYPGWSQSGLSDRSPDGTASMGLYGKEVGVVAVHAGLECSTIGDAKYPVWISFPSADDEGVHSPDEKMVVYSERKKVAGLLPRRSKRIPER